MATPHLFRLGLSLLLSTRLPILPVLLLRAAWLRPGARARLAARPSVLEMGVAVLVKATRT